MIPAWWLHIADDDLLRHAVRVMVTGVQRRCKRDLAEIEGGKLRRSSHHWAWGGPDATAGTPLCGLVSIQYGANDASDARNAAACRVNDS